MRNGKSIFSIRGANFQLSKKATPATETTAKKTEPAGESSTGESSTGDGSVESGAQEASEGETPISQIPDPVEEPKAYLMHIGYLPLPEDDKTWRLYDPDAATGFIKAKGAYNKAKISKKWDEQLQQLSAMISSRQAEADQYGKDAGRKSRKGPQAKAEAKAKRAAILTQIEKWQEEQGEIQAEKDQYLQNVRANLSILTNNSEKYPQAEADENRDKAAQAAGIELMPVPDKHRKTWETANRFDAVLALETEYGLSKSGKGGKGKWSLPILGKIDPTEKEVNNLSKLIGPYFQMKQMEDKLIKDLKFDSPEAKNLKSKIQQVERNPKFISAVAQLKKPADSLRNILTQSIGQIELARAPENEEKIKAYFKRCGGNYEKVYDTFIASLPDTEALSKKLEKVDSLILKLPAT